ncbi:Asp/Glu racemase [Hoeflea sp.]|uniref:maleate cis-trans isomerase family protein n=1 Tax=Hoeflea sp. TaxID=1940281 RepID=UPI003B01D39A
MADSLGHRMKFGVVVPSTNTSVQPEVDAMRPVGVTNHVSRIHIPNIPVTNDDDFNKLIEGIRDATDEAIDRVVTCGPGHVILGMAAETFWEGLEGAAKLQKNMEDRAGVPVTMASDAYVEALKAYGDIKKIAVFTPYMPVADKRVQDFFNECGYEVAAFTSLRCESPQLIAHVSEATLRDTVQEIDGPDIDAIVQVGTNLAFARVAAMAEFWLGKPVIAVSTATYWLALRRAGITDRVAGFGRLLEEF